MLLRKFSSCVASISSEGTLCSWRIIMLSNMAAKISWGGTGDGECLASGNTAMEVNPIKHPNACTQVCILALVGLPAELARISKTKFAGLNVIDAGLYKSGVLRMFRCHVSTYVLR